MSAPVEDITVQMANINLNAIAPVSTSSLDRNIALARAKYDASCALVDGIMCTIAQSAKHSAALMETWLQIKCLRDQQTELAVAIAKARKDETQLDTEGKPREALAVFMNQQETATSFFVIDLKVWAVQQHFETVVRGGTRTLKEMERKHKRRRHLERLVARKKRREEARVTGAGGAGGGV